MFHRFTEPSRRVVVLAQQRSLAAHGAAIAPLHLLWAIMQESDELRSIVGATGVSIADIEAGIEKSQRREPGDEVRTPFSDDARVVVETSWREAQNTDSPVIEPDHLMLAILRVAPDDVLDVFAPHRVSLLQMRQKIVNKLSERPPRTEPDRAPNAAMRGPSIPAPNVRTGSLLASFAVDITDLARQGKLTPVIGRDNETERLIQVLSRRSKNNPCLVGEPGVGKTAVVEGLAQRIISGDVPETVAGCRILSLDMGSLIAGTRVRGDFEERLKKVIAEVESSNDVILFIDEIHTVVAAGSHEGGLDAANLMKPALARGGLRVIGATTLNEFRRHVERDAALERRFQKVVVDPPDVDTAVHMLRGVADGFARHHQVTIDDDAVVAAVRLADRYIADRFLPDKAVDLLDEAGAYLQIHRDLEQRLTASAVARVCESWTSVPVVTSDDDATHLVTLPDRLADRVIGQRNATDAVARAVIRSRAGLRDVRRPAGALLLLGPTGVGKTETAKALAEQVFGDPSALLVFDMSEYMEKHSVSRLVGAPPGYVGFSEGGQLTEAVRRRPYSVVLLDEIEKAHPDVSNLLLQILEEGHLTDSTGRKVDFSHCFVLATSNLGSGRIKRDSFGFNRQGSGSDEHRVAGETMEAAREFFRPELLNRFDDIVVFQRLGLDDVAAIASRFLAGLADRLLVQGVNLVVDDEALAALADGGFDPELGARPLRRLIQTAVETPASELLLSGAATSGSTIRVSGCGLDVSVDHDIGLHCDEVSSSALSGF